MANLQVLPKALQIAAEDEPDTKSEPVPTSSSSVPNLTAEQTFGQIPINTGMDQLADVQIERYGQSLGGYQRPQQLPAHFYGPASPTYRQYGMPQVTQMGAIGSLGYGPFPGAQPAPYASSLGMGLGHGHSPPMHHPMATINHGGATQVTVVQHHHYHHHGSPPASNSGLIASPTSVYGLNSGYSSSTTRLQGPHMSPNNVTIPQLQQEDPLFKPTPQAFQLHAQSGQPSVTGPAPPTLKKGPKQKTDHCQHMCCCVLFVGTWAPCWIAACLGVGCARPFEEGVCDC